MFSKRRCPPRHGQRVRVDALALLARQMRACAPGEPLRPIGLAGLPEEIVPLARAFNDRMSAAERLMVQQRRFLDDASHQLRTPLATLRAQVGHALRQGATGELAQVLHAIERQLVDTSRSVDQLLTLARADATSPSPERFDLAQLLREIACRLLPLAAAKGLDFGVEAAQDPCPCTGDPQLLGEAMGNLAHNAITYAHRGGRVTLGVEASPGRVTFTAVNTGSPIPGPILAGVGRRFVKGPRGGGAGLGLAIAKSIVERHGGQLSLRSEPAKEVNTAQLWWPQAG